MDYKTTPLNKELEMTENLLPEISGLHFGAINEDLILFDYTAFFEENEMQPIDYKLFMRNEKRRIEWLAQQAEKKTSEFFYQNTNGHILVSSELVYLFLSFASDDLFLYFNSLLHNALTLGVAYSTGFVYHQAADRLPTEALEEMIKSRQANESQGTE